jgi:hypothetical protein
VSAQPPPPKPRHELSREQELMRDLRAAKRAGGPVSTDAMYELADIHTTEIANLKADLAKAQSDLRYANARGEVYRGVAEGQQGLDRQIEKATPPKAVEEDKS